MKTNIIKIALIVLGVALIGMTACNAYIGLMFFKLSDGNLFDKLDVVNQYNLFEKFYLGAYSAIFTSILLVLMFGLLIKTFLKNKA